MILYVPSYITIVIESYISSEESRGEFWYQQIGFDNNMTIAT